MATLTVWKFDNPAGADEAESTLADLSNQGLITIHDAATISWAWGRKPKTRQLHSLTGAGALGGGFWGLLFGLLFFVPLLGAAIGAAVGSIAGAMRDVGIDDDFVKTVQGEVTPGTSALFVLTSEAVVDKVRDAFGALHPELIQTNLSEDEEAKLREAFAEN
jgi:uncharacterized membrane protein